MLRVIPGDHTVAEDHLPAVRRELAGDDPQQRRLPRAVRPDDAHPLAPGDPRVHAPVHDPRAERLPHALEPQHLAAGPRRLGELEAERVAVLEDLHLLHLLELLLLALRLARLRRLRPEPLDEALELGPLRLLPLRLGEEPELLLGALPAVVVVRPRVAAQPLRLEREHPVDLPVQELPVVRDEEQRLPLAAEEGVEPGERRDVQVVRRLVEEQQVRIREEEARQRGPHLPAAREVAGRLVEPLRREPEAEQDPLRPPSPVVLLEVVELLVQLGEVLRELELLGLVPRRRERGLRPGEPRLQRRAPGHRRQHRLDERQVGEGGHVLREVPDARAPAHRELARVR